MCRYSVLSDPARRKKYDSTLLGGSSLDPSQEPYRDQTAVLWEAANRGDSNALDVAYRRGGRVAWRNPAEDGRTPLHAASRGGHLECINMLVDRGADIGVSHLRLC
jgi:hypothetical protein